MAVRPPNLIPIIFELIYLCFCLTAVPPLLRTLVAFPSLFILPGVMLLLVLKNDIINLVKLIIEGFFVSTVILVMLTSLMLIFNFPLVPLSYSIMALVLVLFLVIITLIRKIEFKPSKPDILLIIFAFLLYSALLFYFNGVPRRFTPDETQYISYARTGILNGVVPSVKVKPGRSEIALLESRYFWTHLLASFIASTGLPDYQAGLLGIGFLVMTALASSLIIAKNKWLSASVFGIVALNPLLFSFSAMTLNDLAISFYVVFAILFFVKSFSKVENDLSINIVNLFYSLLSAIVLTLIKPNLFFLAPMWIILVYIMIRHRLYRLNRRYMMLFLITTIPVLIYELVIDIPYVVSVWVLRNEALTSLFGKFMFISPVEMIIRMFIVPWWDPSSQPLFSHNFTDYLDYFYTLLRPESSSLVISALIIVTPLLILWKNQHKDFQRNVLASLVTLSFYLFYFQSISFVSLGNSSRYSLWMIPIWVPFTLTVVQDFICARSVSKLASLFLAMFSIIWINIRLTIEKAGVYVGYGLPRLCTIDAIMVQLILLTITLTLLTLKGVSFKSKFTQLAVFRKVSIKIMNSKKALLSFVIVLTLVHHIYFVPTFIEKNWVYEDHGILTVNNTLDRLADNKSLILANNYIQLRPYISDYLLKNGLILPPPDTKEEFLNLIDIAPNGTLFLISDDYATTSYEYANEYIKNYTYNDIITSEKKRTLKITKFNLSNTILDMPFDDANESMIPDHSALKNDGVNEGAQPVEGYFDKALQFNGEAYVSISNKEALNIQNAITLSFLALIEHYEPKKGYMILSKGYSPRNGSYDILIWDSQIWFELGGVGFVSFPLGPYVGAWHHFISTYNGQKMEVFVDGDLVASKNAKGMIRTSPYDLEIGRDSERKGAYFIGILDELQISNKPINQTQFVETYFDHYALRIGNVSINKKETSFFKLIRKYDNNSAPKDVYVKDLTITINQNRTGMLSLEIDSINPKDITILVSSDRSMKIYTTHLDAGTNNVRFEYSYISDLRIVLIDGNEIVYNEFVPMGDLEFIRLSLFIVLFFVIVIYVIICLLNPKFKIKRHQLKTKHIVSSG